MRPGKTSMIFEVEPLLGIEIDIELTMLVNILLQWVKEFLIRFKSKAFSMPEFKAPKYEKSDTH